MKRIAKVYSAATIGLDAQIVEVEVDLGAGLPSFTIVGLPDKAIDEAKERVRSAVKNSDLEFPQHRLTVNLAPADVKKEGPAYDLPIAVGILLAGGQVETPSINKKDNLKDYSAESLFIGELSLNGEVRRINGILPIVIMAKELGFSSICLPEENSAEASMVEGISVLPVKNLSQLVAHLRGEKLIKPAKRSKIDSEPVVYEYDFAYVSGQDQAKRALEIAAAGGHNVLLSGPPGSGKTLLSKSFASILPDLEYEEMIEITKIYSVSGLLHSGKLVKNRPFRSPHHTTSNIALIGGGQWPKPGEISLSHRGVLFLDEFPEFPRSVLEALRQPIEDGVVTVSRAQGSLTFPAEFILVAAQNPCPCGYLTDPSHQCLCTPTQIMRYQKRISGPLLDRIDIHIEVPRLKIDKLTSDVVGEKSGKIRERVTAARSRQHQRFKSKTKTNSEMRSQEIKQFCKLGEKAEEILKMAVNRHSLSARSYHKILKLARTIADLEGVEEIEHNHIAEAVNYRPKEKTY